MTVRCGEVLVYDGPGAGERSVSTVIASLRRDLAEGQTVRTVGSEGIISGAWRASALALVVPGGADLPYCEHLDGKGNAQIRAFVEEDGGSYVGLCAGAYYACRRISFEPGTKLEVTGERELAFFPGIARGAVVPGFVYGSEAGARAVAVSVGRPDGAIEGQPRVERSVEGAGKPAAPAPLPFRDYSNGGPAFFPDADAEEVGSPSSGTDPQSPSTRDPPLAAPDRSPLGSPGPAAAPAETPAAPRQYRALARLADLPGSPLTAVAARIGAGRAVLCGTHPELDPASLPGGSCREALERHESARRIFWRLLLVEAGLPVREADGRVGDGSSVPRHHPLSPPPPSATL